jgi:hypothetical protein
MKAGCYRASLAFLACSLASSLKKNFFLGGTEI